VDLFEFAVADEFVDLAEVVVFMALPFWRNVFPQQAPIWADEKRRIEFRRPGLFREFGEEARNWVPFGKVGAASASAYVFQLSEK
jgi:hypothetical protein